MTLYYLFFGDSIRGTDWRYNYNSNNLAGAKQRLVNMALGYHIQQVGYTYVSIYSKARESEVFGCTLLDIDM